MLKLASQIDSLTNQQIKIERRIDSLNEKIWAIDDRCEEDNERNYTEAEQNKIIEWNNEIKELGKEFDKIQDAIDIISEYYE